MDDDSSGGSNDDESMRHNVYQKKKRMSWNILFDISDARHRCVGDIL